jgi:peroxiredoxin
MTPTHRLALIPALALLLAAALLPAWPALSQQAKDSPSDLPPELVYEPGRLEPRDSVLKVAVGDTAPDFTLPSIRGRNVALSDYRGKKNVVISFVPAAFTPVCSDQWPGYNIMEQVFADHDAVLLGISVDNVPSLHAWTLSMGGLWFPVLSDFWPHGAAAGAYGVLRSDGMADRALFLVDKQGTIRYLVVSDINTRPDVGPLMRALQELP